MVNFLKNFSNFYLQLLFLYINFTLSNCTQYIILLFRKDTTSNGDQDDSTLDADDTTQDDADREDTKITDNKNNECEEDGLDGIWPNKSKAMRLRKKGKKSVQFADGIKPGEGTSPSGGEGDMPSPPPPTGISFREGFKDLRKDKLYRKSKKQEKRVRPPKTKKKVKVRNFFIAILTSYRLEK